jgi:7-cyano-7-deazaguanine synthase in queuosine biosynthesis
MKTITFKADERLDNWLEKEAKTLRVSKSQILRDAVELRMKLLKGKSCYDLSKDLCGSFRSGISDLATNKKHMKNFGKWKS